VLRSVVGVFVRFSCALQRLVTIARMLRVHDVQFLELSI
jgi:hypothetical protein